MTYRVQNRFLSDAKQMVSHIVGAGFGASVHAEAEDDARSRNRFIADLLEPGDEIVLVQDRRPQVPDHLPRISDVILDFASQTAELLA